MRTLFIFLLIANISISCSSKTEKSNEIRSIVYNTTDTPSEFFDITPLIDTTQFEIIPLESHSEAIIGDISDVYIRDNKII
ncbi:MAG: hypothetical protein ACRDD8_11475, partial [Bacteroidales bacterium]